MTWAHHPRWCRPYESGLVGLVRLRRLVVIVVLQALLELLLGLADRPSELRELRSTKQNEDDHENDDEFRAFKEREKRCNGHGNQATPLARGIHLVVGAAGPTRDDRGVLECVMNLSEGRDPDLIASLTAAAGDGLLDVHVDAHHNRSVFTMIGEEAPRRLATSAVELLDLRTHHGVHPRIGVVDVVPFVALEGTNPSEAVTARDRFCVWAGEELALPCFRYGDERTLPDVRRQAFTTLAPDCGPTVPHPTAGACAVGARPPLIAYNLWVTDLDAATLRSVAASLRGPHLRTLGLEVGKRFQVSCNLIDPAILGPAEVADRVAQAVGTAGGRVTGTELVGLVPAGVLEAIPTRRWPELDLAPDRTIEARIRTRSARQGQPDSGEG